MTYPEAIQYIESFINYEKITFWPYKKSLKLERIKDFLTTIEDPQDRLKCIHIAGTKGKGSTCAFISYILRQAGFKVGLYTSPHLSDFRERIRILDSRFLAPDSRTDKDFEGMISQDELRGLIEKLKPKIEKYNKDSKYGPLSCFEFYTSLAFVYFKEKKVDLAVLETGLGGRLDATNVAKPLVCAITPISYEHTQQLGNTLTEIATEKSNIIKSRQAIVITAPQKKEVMQVIRNRCKEVGVKLYEVNKDISFEKTGKGLSIKTGFGEYSDLKIRLLGEQQLINGVVAVGVIEALRFYNINVGIDSIRQGLYNTIWPGRCEVISRNPLVVLDGAQNIASSRALKQTIKENFSAESAAGGKGGKYKRLILVLGISKDKDIDGICNELCPLADEIILTQADNPRAASINFIEQVVKRLKLDKMPITKTESVQEARAYSLSIAKKEDLILVCGSLFVVGEFRDVRI